MNISNSKYENNSQTKQSLIAKGIQQAWCRRFSSNIHSGVRVKMQQQPIQENRDPRSKLSSLNHIQSMLKHFRIESAVCQNSSKQLDHSSQNQSLSSYELKSILHNNNHDLLLHKQNHETNEKDKTMNSIGVQTTILAKLDRQTSCDILVERKKLIRKSQSSSLSTVSDSKTSISDESSTYTDSTSTDMTTLSTDTTTTTTTNSSTNMNHHKRYQRNKNRNSNAIDTDIEETLERKSQTEKSIQKSSYDEQSLQNIKINTPCCSPSTSSTAGKQRFFSAFLSLFSYLRLSSFKRDRASTSTSKVLNMEQNIRPPTSRCRRSAARNFNYNSSIEPKNHYLLIGSEEDSLSKQNHLEKQPSLYSIQNKSLSMRKQYRRINKSNSTIVDSQRLKKNQRKHSYRQERHTHRHRKKRKQIPADNHSKELVGESIKPSVCTMEDPSKNSSSVHEDTQQTSILYPTVESERSHHVFLQEQDLSSTCIDNHSTDTVPCLENHEIFKSNPLPSSFQKILNQHVSHPIESVRLRVKNKNLISNLSQSSIYHVDDSIKCRHRNLINEFKSILQQTKSIHTNNNSFDDDNLKAQANFNASNIASTFCSINNLNDNKSHNPSMASSHSSTKSIENHSISIPQTIKNQSDTIREGVEQLIRYQELSRSYKLTSNKAVRQFLTRSSILSPQSLHKLSIKNEPNSTKQVKEKN
ncbi:unnamed protein product [Rotaria socialis]|uniref:Uncharacterized protein n=1 Tax=Rotaria socialis TaxID=392032 RepID=A0A821CD43_9BILA|nr:unnamed protein product [Rotaria socialis]CAF4608104.1 unnamed protein product [Rotaria socialis]